MPVFSFYYYGVPSAPVKITDRFIVFYDSYKDSPVMSYFFKWRVQNT